MNETPKHRMTTLPRVRLLALAAALVGCLAGCLTPTPPAPQAKVRHVVLIGCDGLGSYALRKADPKTIPNISRLMAEGAWTLKARAVLPSESAQNWATMFMGCGVEVHGYCTWDPHRPATPSLVVNERGHAPTIFSELRRQRPEARIDVTAEWVGIGPLADQAALDSYFLVPGDYEKTPNLVVDKGIEALLAHKPTLTAICIDQLDHVGHRVGHDTPAYYAALERLDGHVGRILAAIDEAGMAQDTAVILTADHGGVKKTHGGPSPAEMEIPFIVAGPIVRQRGEIPESVMQYDCAAHIAYLLGLTPPQSWTGRPLTRLFAEP